MILALNTTSPADFKKHISPDINPDAVILFNQQEWCYTSFGNVFGWDNLIDYINEKNCELFVINGSFPGSPLLHDVNDPRFRNVNVVDYPLNFMFIWHDKFVNYKQAEIKYPFVCLNGKPHWFRCLQIDKLAKYGLLEKAAFSWNSSDWGQNERNIDCSFDYKDWQYWTPKITLLDQMKDIKNYGWSNQIPDQYYESFCQLVTEATIYSYFITEKTIPALKYMKPFIISSRVGIHKVLKDFGFELYDEVFDYSFDSEPDEEKRFEMIAQNLLRIANTSNDELTKLTEKIYPKLLHNKEHYKNLIQDINKIDPFVVNLCENHREIIEPQHMIYTHYLHCKKHSK